MHFDFLESADDRPLVKHFSMRDGAIHIDPFPNVRNLISHREEVGDMAALYAVLTKHAAVGHCMLKGLLTKRLENESRAGYSPPDRPTEWMLLDLDFTEGFPSIEAFLGALDPALVGASYIFNHSSSAGIRCAPGLRGHIFIRLSKQVLPATLKSWLIHKNLTVPGLRSQLALSDNGQSLKYPLDISTCQNDKLIYIADPICTGITDPIKGNRFVFVPGRESVDLNVSGNFAAVSNALRETIVMDMRKTAGLPKTKPKYQQLNNEVLLLNPDPMTVTGRKEARDWIYLNFNGGDSWGYFVDPKRPEIIGNFKGEPLLKLETIAPDIYSELSNETGSSDLKKRTLTAFAFRERATDSYMHLIHDLDTNTIDSVTHVSSKDKIADFYAQLGQVAPEVITDWEVTFNPTIKKVIDAERGWVNLFKPTEFMLNTKPVSNRDKFPVIDRILTHICVDDETKAHFTNWLAFIWQTHRKSTTAWLFGGVQGTGKGLMFSHVLTPLFGMDHTFQIQIRHLDEPFNGYMRTNMLLLVDEADLKQSANNSRSTNQIKNWITERYLLVREMRANAIKVENYSNLIFATNIVDPIELEEGDRRFNIAPAQQTKLVISNDEVSLQIPKELQHFADYLQSWPVDDVAVITVLQNEARKRLLAVSVNSVDLFFNALREGNYNYLEAHLRDNPILAHGSSYPEFQRVCKNIEANLGKEIVLTRDEIVSCYQYLQNVETVTPAKFSRMCNLHRLKVGPIYTGAGRIQRGIKVTFTKTPEDTAPL